MGETFSCLEHYVAYDEWEGLVNGIIFEVNS